MSGRLRTTSIPGRLLGSANPGWKLTPNKVEKPLEGVDYTIITRSNAALFQCAFDAVEEIELWEGLARQAGLNPPRLTLGFVGTTDKQKFSPMQSYKFGLILDIYNLYAGAREKVYSSYIKTFNTYEELEAAAKDEDTPDVDLVGPVGLINRHRSKIPGMIWKINERSGDPAGNLCRVRLTTAHKAKGLEWDRVVLSDDYTPLVLERPTKGGNGVYPRLASLKETPPDEFNLVYMAITRAKVDLKINESLEEFIQFLKTAEAAA